MSSATFDFKYVTVPKILSTVPRMLPALKPVEFLVLVNGSAEFVNYCSINGKSSKIISRRNNSVSCFSQEALVSGMNQLALTFDEVEYSQIYGLQASAAPYLTAVIPSWGPALGGTWITVSGRHFSENLDLQLRVGNAAATCELVDDYSLTCKLPAQLFSEFSDYVTVSFMSPDMNLASSPLPFQYRDPPIISNIGSSTVVYPEQRIVVGGEKLQLLAPDISCIFGCSYRTIAQLISLNAVQCVVSDISTLNSLVTNGAVSLNLEGNSMATNYIYASVKQPPSLLSVFPSVFVSGSAFQVTVTGSSFMKSVNWTCYSSSAAAIQTVAASDTSVVCHFDAEMTESFFVRVCPGPAICSHRSFASNATFVSNANGNSVSLIASTKVLVLPNSQLRIFADVLRFTSSTGIRCVFSDGFSSIATLDSASSATCSLPVQRPAVIMVRLSDSLGTASNFVSVPLYSKPSTSVTPSVLQYCGGDIVIVSGPFQNMLASEIDCHFDFVNTKQSIVNASAIFLISPSLPSGEAQLKCFFTSSNQSTVIVDETVAVAAICSKGSVVMSPSLISKNLESMILLSPNYTSISAGLPLSCEWTGRMIYLKKCESFIRLRGIAALLPLKLRSDSCLYLY